MTVNKIASSTKDGRGITIEIDDFGEEISVTDAAGDEVGSIELELIDCEHDEYYKITWMYLDKQGESYLRQGIGRKALLFHIECFAMPLEASDNDGTVKNDGSHLTGDAPSFVSRMRAEGIIRHSSYEFRQEEDDG